MARIELGITVPRRRFAVDLSLVVEGGTTALAGPSGAGKTTVLQALAGLARPSAGRIRAGREVWFDAAAGVDLPPERRSVGYVPQEHALFPHLDVRANVAFGALDPAGVDGLLRSLGLAELAGERPARLSGGERGRVALARALAREPAVLALDEPLATLDAMTRAEVRDELAARLARLELPVLLVTHDFGDASLLADRIAVIVDGTVRQRGTPAELVAAPADAFVAAFTGAATLVVHAEGHEASATGGERIALAAPHTGPCLLALHPWHVRVQAAPPAPGRTGIAGHITGWAVEGERVRARVGAVTGELRGADTAGLGPGATAWATWDPGHAVLLPAPDRSQQAPRFGDDA